MSEFLILRGVNMADGGLVAVVFSSRDSLERLLEESVLPSGDVSLDHKERVLLGELDRFEAPYLEEKLLGERVFDSSAAYNGAFAEFKRFVALSLVYGKNLAMPSKEIDAVWHQFILFTKKYREFCDRFLGRYLDHNPNTSFTPLDPEGLSNLRGLYRKTYGDIPSLWDMASAEDCSVGSGACTQCGSPGSGSCNSSCGGSPGSGSCSSGGGSPGG
ncbi:MAG TPA: hypothetical protein VJG90_01650 [Candidatus Nanoarchaeia archaeon]|nr:hypothetical protein [Candidatus Nanoarchaeia archaeon]